MTTPSSSDNLFAGIAKTAAPAPAPVTKELVIPDADPAPAPQMSELDMLKQRAAVMGVKHSNNISVEALRKKIDAKLEGEAETAEENQAEADVVEEASLANSTVSAEQIAAAQAILAAAGVGSAGPAGSAATGPKISPARVMTLREKLYKEEMALVRLRITNLDPKKKDLPGEIFTVANEVLGAVRKYIPYGEVTDNGYHVPMCIYRQLDERKFLSIKVRKNAKQQEVVETTWAREFALEVLPALTEVELARLAAAQAAAGGISDNA
ncbi:MAG: hypothetical protein EOQ44_25355 [Mesorhizobium sp.]|uniref:hypothetical protein n=1 Tax=Mesorhizobium sp. TaxID=1871066 RepID=UPI000FE7D01C|nr:hypothetical protein [Mesorhizobium sp.]RWB40468.1 MAG: hypothetical protein EOQ44_25355 [Mesorhizobium sp.]